MRLREALTQRDLLEGDLLEVARCGDLSGAVEWLGPFSVLEAEGHAVRVLDRTSELEAVERRVSYARIRRRTFGPALPAWLERERERGPFESGDRVMTPRGAGAVVYRRMKCCGCVAFSGCECMTRVAAYSVKLDGVNHTGVMYGPEKLSEVVS